ncbi:hypothetical protein V6N11_082394 [Hibiscus sabdariffa]|uniref:Uncharacterized protein n=2 Tax=Hibiscus sabdariffa TaxID=183260 RepID=A0ABR2BTL9_9ROSI
MLAEPTRFNGHQLWWSALTSDDACWPHAALDGWQSLDKSRQRRETRKVNDTEAYQNRGMIETNWKPPKKKLHFFYRSSSGSEFSRADGGNTRQVKARTELTRRWCTQLQ